MSTSRIVNCGAQMVVTSENRDDFMAKDQIRFRYFEGGIPLTNQAKLPVITVVLYSVDGKRAIVATVEKDTSKQVRVLPFFDTLRMSSKGWVPVDVSGGPGSADATTEFLKKLPATAPLQTATVVKVDNSACVAVEPN
jgi:hypothetical protein